MASTLVEDLERLLQRLKYPGFAALRRSIVGRYPLRLERGPRRDSRALTATTRRDHSSYLLNS
jgi:hypothetical protein